MLMRILTNKTKVIFLIPYSLLYIYNVVNVNLMPFSTSEIASQGIIFFAVNCKVDPIYPLDIAADSSQKKSFLKRIHSVCVFLLGLEKWTRVLVHAHRGNEKTHSALRKRLFSAACHNIFKMGRRKSL